MTALDYTLAPSENHLHQWGASERQRLKITQLQFHYQGISTCIEW
ncbi:hypothetical protein [Sulfitobacter sp. DFL-23]|nr:hypothetical protein [Sulfitobacter sp. DFL-23]